MPFSYFNTDTYPPIVVRIRKLSDNTVFEDITGYVFVGAFLNTEGAVALAVAASRFAISDAANGEFKYTPQSNDLLKLNAGTYKLRVTCTRPSSGGDFTRTLADDIAITT